MGCKEGLKELLKVLDSKERIEVTAKCTIKELIKDYNSKDYIDLVKLLHFGNCYIRDDLISEEEWSEILNIIVNFIYDTLEQCYAEEDDE